MKKILVPCDFSKQAINAFRFAVDCASKSRGEVHALHIIELPVMHDSVLMPVLSFEETLLGELKEKAESEFDKLKKKYGSEDVKITTVVAFGHPSKSIVQYIEENKIELVVMGTKGATGLKEILVGSNAEKVVRSSPVPVIAVKNYPRLDMIRNIVFPNTLHTEIQEDLVLKVKAMQNFFGAHLHIVFVNTPSNFTRDIITNKRLQQFAKRFLFKNYSVHVFNDLYEEDGIINFSNLIKGDLIAMGTHSRKGISHVVNGSIAEDVVNHTDAPIWTYTMKNE
ncbi:MAG: universal stress protein [Cyclobacteriaceae bacterium]|jgi:nucleotide-binding universal stress UspA family protein|nr:universal stress protein [Cytophagales bacterium]MCZ8327905.1 universal stress protein [Cyclobacteriaceae bacterium]